VAAAAVVAGANTLLNSRLVLWQSQRKAISAAALQVGNSVLVMSLSVAGVLWLHLGAAGRMGGALAGALILAALAVYSITVREKLRGPIVRENVAAAVRFGGPLIPHVLAGVVMATSDRFIVGSMLGPSAVGTYGVAAQLGMVMAILGDAFVKTYGPWMYARLNRNESRDRHAVVGATWLAIPVFLVVAVCAGVALQWLGPAVVGRKFHEDLPLAWWFVFGGAFNGMYLSVAGFFFFRSRTELVSAVTATSAIVGVALAFFLVRTIGVAGGGISYCATQALAFVIALVIAIRQTPELPWRAARESMATAFRELR
jgi:O-antigen/teichoic acid export membrane protein